MKYQITSNETIANETGTAREALSRLHKNLFDDYEHFSNSGAKKAMADTYEALQNVKRAIHLLNKIAL